MTDAVNGLLEPMRHRREAFSAADAAELLARGNETAAAIAAATLDQVRAAMGMDYLPARV